MVVYNLSFIIILISACIFCSVRGKLFFSYNNSLAVDGRPNYDLLARFGICVVVFSYLIYISAQRFNMGFDYFQYVFSFERMAECSSLEQALLSNDSHEKGFIILQYLIYQIAPSYEAFYFFHTLLTVGLFGYAIFMFSSAPHISALLFIALDTFAFTMNLSRQAIAIAILFVGWGYLRRRKLVRFILLVCIAFFFHTSALIILPIAVFCMIKPRMWLYICVLFGGGAVYLVSLKVFERVTEKGVFGRYNIYLNNFFMKSGGDKRYCYSMMVIALCILIVYFATRWREKSDYARVSAAIALCILVLSLLRLNHYMLDRVVIYPMMYLIFCIPDMLEFFYESYKDDVLCFLKGRKLSAYLIRTDYEGGELYKPESREEAKRLVRKSSVKLLAIKSSILIAAICALAIPISLYYTTSASTGSHRAYPYETTNNALMKLSGMEKTEEERLKTTKSYYEYLSLLDNEDYIVSVSYAKTESISLLRRQYSIYMLSALKDVITDYGLYEYIDGINRDTVKNFGLIIDGGNACESGQEQSVQYSFDGASFTISSIGKVQGIIINGVDYKAYSKGINFVVYSKSQGKVIDCTSFMPGDLYYTPTLYHSDIARAESSTTENKLREADNIYDLLSCLQDTSNTCILVNNIEDFSGAVPSKTYDSYFSAIGSSLTMEILCKQNYAGIRMGGEWRESWFAGEAAKINSSINGMSLEISADSYKSYIKYNGKDISSMESGLNIIVISPDSEILFNGMIDFYGTYSVYRYEDYYDL